MADDSISITSKSLKILKDIEELREPISLSEIEAYDENMIDLDSEREEEEEEEPHPHIVKSRKSSVGNSITLDGRPGSSHNPYAPAEITKLIDSSEGYFFSLLIFLNFFFLKI